MCPVVELDSRTKERGGRDKVDGVSSNSLRIRLRGVSRKLGGGWVFSELLEN